MMCCWPAAWKRHVAVVTAPLVCRHVAIVTAPRVCRHVAVVTAPRVCVVTLQSWLHLECVVTLQLWLHLECVSSRYSCDCTSSVCRHVAVVTAPRVSVTLQLWLHLECVGTFILIRKSVAADKLSNSDWCLLVTLGAVVLLVTGAIATFPKLSIRFRRKNVC